LAGRLSGRASVGAFGSSVPGLEWCDLVARMMVPSYAPATSQLASEAALPHAERSVQINRPPAAVFAFFADSENDLQWRPHVKEITRNGPVGPGMTYRQRIAGPGGRAVASDFEVTAYEPDTHLAFRVTVGPVRPVGDYTFRPVADGTEVTLTLSAELAGVKKLLMSRPVQRAMESEVAGLDRAKRILESES
jgi:uncharacterized protein YndB with AHSA1/START domain